MRLLHLALVALVLAVPPAEAQRRAESRHVANPVDVCETGTAEASLDVGGVRAALYDIGNLFWSGSGVGYEVPQGSGRHAMFSSGLWLGGQVDGDLRFAGSTYGPWEYWPGPLDAAGQPTAELCAAFDRIWVVSTADLAAFRESGTATDDLADWPVGAGAPFFVDANGDGAQGDAEPTVELRPGDPGYAPARRIDLGAGERPVVFGAQTAWWVMNDRGGEHRWSEAAPLGAEVRVTAWTLADADRASLYLSTFYRYDVLNRSPETVDDLFIGLWTDADIGYFNDDYIHADSTRSMLVFYNRDEHDEGEGGYGIPPALGVDVLSGGYGAMHTWSNGGPTGDPNNAKHAYALLQSIWKDGTPLRAGGGGYSLDGPRTRWAFSGDPVAHAFWSQENTDGAGTPTSSPTRFAEISAAFGALAPGAEATFDVAFLFAQGTDRLDSVARLRGVSDDAQAAYASGDLFRPVAATAPPPLPPAPTAAPTLVAPADGAVFSEEAVTFEWTATAGAASYWLETSDTPDFENPRRWLAPGTRLETSTGIAPANRTRPLHWRVVPTYAGSEGPPSEARAVTLYTFSPGLLATVEVVGPGGTDPCGPEAGSTGGCSDVFGNNVARSYNSTGDYIGTSIGAGSEDTIGGYGPSEFEIRFTAEGSLAFYPFTTGRLIRVPFEVWDIGQVTPGDANDPADDLQMVPALFADSGGECAFGYVGPTRFGLGPTTQRIYAYYPTDNYAAFHAEAAPLVDADPDGCPTEPATASAADRIDLDRGRPIQRFVLEQASDAGLDALEGTVIRFYTADRLPVASEDALPTGALALAVRPNPSASVATVDYRLAEAGPVRLRLVDVLGREVAVLADGDRPAGDHRAEVDAATLAPGVYVVVLDAAGARAVRMMTVVR